jgi:hypothetical protein
LKFPFGHPVGQKGDTLGQRRVILEALKILVEAKTPGEIIDLPFRWKRTDFTALPPVIIEDKEIA